MEHGKTITILEVCREQEAVCFFQHCRLDACNRAAMACAGHCEHLCSRADHIILRGLDAVSPRKHAALEPLCHGVECEQCERPEVKGGLSTGRIVESSPAVIDGVVYIGSIEPACAARQHRRIDVELCRRTRNTRLWLLDPEGSV